MDHRRLAELFEVSCGLGAGSSADRTAPAELSVLELLASEASRLPVHMPEAKVGIA